MASQPALPGPARERTGMAQQANGAPDGVVNLAWRLQNANSLAEEERQRADRLESEVDQLREALSHGGLPDSMLELPREASGHHHHHHHHHARRPEEGRFIRLFRRHTKRLKFRLWRTKRWEVELSRQSRQMKLSCRVLHAWGAACSLHRAKGAVIDGKAKRRCARRAINLWHHQRDRSHLLRENRRHLLLAMKRVALRSWLKAVQPWNRSRSFSCARLESQAEPFPYGPSELVPAVPIQEEGVAFRERLWGRRMSIFIFQWSHQCRKSGLERHFARLLRSRQVRLRLKSAFASWGLAHEQHRALPSRPASRLMLQRAALSALRRGRALLCAWRNAQLHSRRQPSKNAFMEWRWLHGRIKHMRMREEEMARVHRRGQRGRLLGLAYLSPCSTRNAFEHGCKAVRDYPPRRNWGGALAQKRRNHVAQTNSQSKMRRFVKSRSFLRWHRALAEREAREDQAIDRVTKLRKQASMRKWKARMTDVSRMEDGVSSGMEVKRQERALSSWIAAAGRARERAGSVAKATHLLSRVKKSNAVGKWVDLARVRDRGHGKLRRALRKLGALRKQQAVGAWKVFVQMAKDKAQIHNGAIRKWSALRKRLALHEWKLRIALKSDHGRLHARVREKWLARRLSRALERLREGRRTHAKRRKAGQLLGEKIGNARSKSSLGAWSLLHQARRKRGKALRKIARTRMSISFTQWKTNASAEARNHAWRENMGALVVGRVNRARLQSSLRAWRSFGFSLDHEAKKGRKALLKIARLRASMCFNEWRRQCDAQGHAQVSELPASTPEEGVRPATDHSGTPRNAEEVAKLRIARARRWHLLALWRKQRSNKLIGKRTRQRQVRALMKSVVSVLQRLSSWKATARKREQLHDNLRLSRLKAVGSVWAAVAKRRRRIRLNAQRVGFRVDQLAVKTVVRSWRGSLIGPARRKRLMQHRNRRETKRCFASLRRALEEERAEKQDCKRRALARWKERVAQQERDRKRLQQGVEVMARNILKRSIGSWRGAIWNARRQESHSLNEELGRVRHSASAAASQLRSAWGHYRLLAGSSLPEEGFFSDEVRNVGNAASPVSQSEWELTLSLAGEEGSQEALPPAPPPPMMRLASGHPHHSPSPPRHPH